MNNSTKCEDCIKADVCSRSKIYKETVNAINEQFVTVKDGFMARLGDGNFIKIHFECPSYSSKNRISGRV